MNKVIVIVGPTAVGKTKLSIDIAKYLQTEIISGDSMQVYEGMDIGTGKATEAEMANIPHYMLDIKQPDEEFSVAEFKSHVEEHIASINDKGMIPIVVGGSGLYIQAVLYDYQFSDRKRDETITKRLEAELAEIGNEQLHERLEKIDPDQAAKIHPNNFRRVIRALEVYESTGKTLTELQSEQTNEAQYEHLIIGLEMERALLYEQINLRVDGMVEAGLVREVQKLYDAGYEDTQAMKAIGYKEIIPYIKGEISLEAAVDTLKRNSRRYAKRQYTWFKNQLDVNWFNLTTSNYETQKQQIFELIKKRFSN
ncbi:MAG TPA: tRNA (adenosine(37)-N6)-dimethylallyltransferase MiaA [Pseudogracilibacillus sp.]|nr:tRNA (adenosine(37)-N6)-dimethylallyltransferase MiaA [Pseudogracilibacillus sp.]